MKEPTTWLVEAQGVAIATIRDSPGKIRVTSPGDAISEERARDLFVRALAQLGGIDKGNSATEKVALEMAVHHLHGLQVAQRKLEDALHKLGVLEGENRELKLALGRET